MKIIFVNPVIRPQDPPFHIPFGIATLSRIADQLGHEVGILDLNAHRLGVDAFREELKDADYKDADVVGVGALSSQYKFVKPLIPIIKNVHPNTLLVLGGGLLTTLPENIMRLLPQVDVGFIGESERTFTEFLDVVDNKNFSKVKGLIYREDGELVRTPYRPLIEDLDKEVPWPHWDMLPLEIYFQFSANLMGPASPPELQRSRRRMSIVTERGCPRQCSFCCHLSQSVQDQRRIYDDPTIKGSPVRWHSAKYLVDMVKHLRFRYQVDFVSILDENFLANKKRAYEVCDLWESEDLAGIVHFGILGDVASGSDYELLQRLKDVGCFVAGSLVQCNPEPKQIEQIKVGDHVLTHAGDYSKVKATKKREYSGTIYTVRPNGGISVALTEEHPLLVVRSHKFRNRIDRSLGNWKQFATEYAKLHATLDDVEWILVSNLNKETDLLVYPVIQEIKDVDTAELEFVPDLDTYNKAMDLRQKGLGRVKIAKILRVPTGTIGSWIYSGRKPGGWFNVRKKNISVEGDLLRLVGYYLAEGYCDKNGVSFSFGSHEVDFHKDVEEILETIFSPRHIIKRLRGSTCEIVVRSKALSSFFGQFGSNAHSKRIPEWVMFLPHSKQRELIKGYWRGDGCTVADKTVFRRGKRVKQGGGFVASTASSSLAYGIQCILVRLGVVPCVTTSKTRKTTIKGRKAIGGKTFYSLWVRGSFVEKMKNILDVQLDLERKHWKKESVHKDNFILVPIRKLTKERFNGDVYNLEVENGDESYCMATYITAHNCTYISYGGEVASDRLLKEIKKYTTVEQTQKAIDATMKAGITPIVTYMTGYPTEKIEDIIATVEFWKRNQMLVRPFLITPYPGTELWFEHKDRILAQHDGDIEKFLLSLGDATDLSANISPYDDATLLGLRELATMQDLDRIRRWADGKK